MHSTSWLPICFLGWLNVNKYGRCHWKIHANSFISTRQVNLIITSDKRFTVCLYLQLWITDSGQSNANVET